MDRKSETELVFTDLARFECRLPFHLKNEAGLMKVEVSGLKSRKSQDGEGSSSSGRKGRKNLADDNVVDDEGDCPAPEEDEEIDGLTAEEFMAIEELDADLAAPEGGAATTDDDAAADGVGTLPNEDS